jgi:hypothetical protein
MANTRTIKTLDKIPLNLAKIDHLLRELLLKLSHEGGGKALRRSA